MRTILLILTVFAGFAGHAQDFSLSDLEDVHQFTSLEEALLKPDSVYRLRLKKRLKTVPAEVFTSFPNLVELDLSKNRLKKVPPQIGNLKNLKRLILFMNKIDSFPPEIGDLVNLEELIINRNELYALPDEIGRLQKLRYIDMWSNNISVLPHSMTDMAALEEIDMRVIVITDFEQADIRDQLPNVKVQMDEGCNCGN